MTVLHQKALKAIAIRAFFSYGSGTLCARGGFFRGDYEAFAFASNYAGLICDS